MVRQNIKISVPCKTLNDEIISGLLKLRAARRKIEELLSDLSSALSQDPEYALLVKTHLRDAFHLRIPPSGVLPP